MAVARGPLQRPSLMSVALGSVCRKVRLQAGETQRYVAIRAEVTDVLVNRFERGRFPGDQATIETLLWVYAEISDPPVEWTQLWVMAPQQLVRWTRRDDPVPPWARDVLTWRRQEWDRRSRLAE